MRKVTLFIIFMLLNVALLFVAFGHALFRLKVDTPVLEERARIVRTLGLTDLSLFTDARYTRHLSQADLHSAFQDYPGSFEHFPSGSLALPPLLIRGGCEPGSPGSPGK